MVKFTKFEEKIKFAVDIVGVCSQQFGRILFFFLLLYRIIGSQIWLYVLVDDPHHLDYIIKLERNIRRLDRPILNRQPMIKHLFIFSLYVLYFE
jgi:hypothetical protein